MIREEPAQSVRGISIAYFDFADADTESVQDIRNPRSRRKEPPSLEGIPNMWKLVPFGCIPWVSHMEQVQSTA